MLDLAALLVPGVRPPLLEAALATDVRELLAFRHLFRNVYGTDLRWDRLTGLAQGLPDLHARVRAALQGVARFLDGLVAAT